MKRLIFVFAVVGGNLTLASFVFQALQPEPLWGVAVSRSLMGLFGVIMTIITLRIMGLLKIQS